MHKNELMRLKHILLLSFLHFSISTLCAQISNALVLDGCTNYFQVTDNDLLDHDQVLSIECWVQPNCDDGNKILVGKEWCDGDYGYYLSVIEGRLLWSFSKNGFCSPTSVQNRIQTIDVVIPTDVFTHVAVVHSQTEVKLFVNGLELQTEYDIGSFGQIFNSSEPLRIGAYKKVSGTISNHFSGLIDEVRVWNIALDEPLINQRKDIPLAGNEDGLVLYFDMEDTGQGNTLTLENHALSPVADATPMGTLSNKPFTIFHEDYDDNLFDLGNDIIACDPNTLLTTGVENYKSIEWSTGETSESINVNAIGQYSVLMETELCKFYMDTIWVNPGTLMSDESYETCEGNPYIYNGVELDAGTTTDFPFTSIFGCDSIVTVTINSTSNYRDTIYGEACFEEFYTYNGSMIAAGNTEIFDLNSISNCDSTIVVIVEELDTSIDFVEFDICDNELLEYEGMELEAGETIQLDFINSVGCDSTIFVVVSGFPSYSENIDFYICPDDSIFYAGQYLFPNSFQEYSFTTFQGCDSIEQINVFELGTIPIPLNFQVCPSETIDYNGSTYGAGTSETFTFQSSQGCDSLVELTVAASPDFTFNYETDTICYNQQGAFIIPGIQGQSAPYSYSIDGVNFQSENEFTQLTGGDYTIYVQDNNNCVKTIDATIPVHERITVEIANTTLTCENSTTTISPTIVSGNLEDISFIWPNGLTGDSFVANQVGNYVLEVNNTCENLMVNFEVDSEATNLENFVYIPNCFSPNGDGINDKFVISPSYDAIINSFEIHIFSRWGEEIYQSFDYTESWDGKMKNGIFKPGVHTWWMRIDVTHCGLREVLFKDGGIMVVH